MYKKLLLMSLFFALVIAACSKKEDAATPTGTLTIQALDSTDSPILGSVTMTLYPDQASWTSKTNAIATKKTDANGKAVFTGITTDALYVYAAADTGFYNNNWKTPTTPGAAGTSTASRYLSGLSTTGASTKSIYLKDSRPKCVIDNVGYFNEINDTQDTANVYSLTLDGGALGSGLKHNYTFVNNIPLDTGAHELIATRTNGSGNPKITKNFIITRCALNRISLAQ